MGRILFSNATSQHSNGEKGKDLPRIEINIACEGWPPEEDLQRLARQSVSSAVKSAGLKFAPDAELSLMFGDDETLCALNSRYRGINKATNVLSFPDQQILPGQEAGAILGDIAFALQTVKREADLEGKRFDHHLSHLMIHGFLHLFGYDHQNDDEAQTMESLEIRALAILGIENPYKYGEFSLAKNPTQNPTQNTTKNNL